MVNKKRKFGLKEIVLGLTLAIATPMVFGCGSVRKGGLIDTIMTKSSELPGDKFLYDHGIIPRALTVPSVQERLDKERGLIKGKNRGSVREENFHMKDEDSFDEYHPWVVVEIINPKTKEVKKRFVENIYSGSDKLPINDGRYRWPDHKKYVEELCNGTNPSKEGYEIKRIRGPDPYFGIKLINSFEVKCPNLKTKFDKMTSVNSPHEKSTIIEQDLSK